MKGEVYGKRDLSPLVGMEKTQNAKGGKQEGNKKPRRRK